MNNKRNPDWQLFDPSLIKKVDALHNFVGKAPKTRIKTSLQLMHNPRREAEVYRLFEHLNVKKKRGMILGPCMVIDRLNDIMGNDDRALTQSTDHERAQLNARMAWMLRTPGRINRQAPSELWTTTNAQFQDHVTRTLFRIYYLQYRAERKPDSQATELATKASRPPAIAAIPAPPQAIFKAKRTIRTNVSLDDDDAANMLRVAQSGDLGLDPVKTCLARVIKILEIVNGSRPIHARTCTVPGIDWDDEKILVHEPRPNRPVGEDPRLSFKGGSGALRELLTFHPALMLPQPPPTLGAPPPMLLFSPAAAAEGLYAPMEMDEYTELSAAPADVLNIPDYTPYQHRHTFASALGADLESLDNISLAVGHGGKKVIVFYLDFSKPKRAHRAHQKMLYLMAKKRLQLGDATA